MESVYRLVSNEPCSPESTCYTQKPTLIEACMQYHILLWSCCSLRRNCSVQVPVVNRVMLAFICVSIHSSLECKHQKISWLHQQDVHGPPLFSPFCCPGDTGKTDSSHSASILFMLSPSSLLFSATALFPYLLATLLNHLWLSVLSG